MASVATAGNVAGNVAGSVVAAGRDASKPAVRCAFAHASSSTAMSGDTFGVGVHLTDTELRFVVRVPSDVDSGWTDPEAFQSLVEEVVWERLNQEAVLSTIAEEHETGDTVSLGTVTLRPDETVVDAALEDPTA
ncbi:hypothetical protein [Haloparvum sp. AD34]